uniref:RING-type E3 ubiquitin transferase n=1 Tax=Chrysemys picta bellii TaxID=8478 RepID=A0A8C3HBP4_CHRPI
MAAENPLKNLQKESTCPICLEYFTEPVTLECGHNFCRACIAQCCEGSNTAVSCPQCRETVLQATKGTGGDGVCGEHQETLKLFCEEDETPICVICRESQAHRAHTVVPIQEAAQEYKEKIQTHLKALREEREKLLGFKVAGEGKRQEYLVGKIVSEFQKLRRFLEEKERLLLAQLEKLDEEIVRIQNENVSKLSKQISHLSELISEMEGKCQKPASEFLQVRLREKQRAPTEIFLRMPSAASSPSPPSVPPAHRQPRRSTPPPPSQRFPPASISCSGVCSRNWEGGGGAWMGCA